MSAPRPCPWCGSTIVGVSEGSTFRWRVAHCLECGAQAPEVRAQTLGEGTREEWEAAAQADALAAWNERATEGSSGKNPGKNPGTTGD